MSVRYFVVDFIKEAGKIDPQYLPSFIRTLAFLTNDSSEKVVKRALITFSGQSLRSVDAETTNLPLL